jgi:8-oxo-dGTP pyrophosphatase MutT (NUDIX family)
MFAAREGRSTLGIPKKVGEEFVGSKDAKPAAGVAITGPGNTALFLKRARTADHPGEWCWPGGGIEAGEKPEDAARRETAEETGYKLNGIKPIHRAISDDGVDFTTFHQDVGEHFVPKVNDEHAGWAWASMSDPPQPLHPGVKAMLEKVTKDADVRAHDQALALDRSSVRSYDKDGRMRVERAHISKANVCPYNGSEIPDYEALGLDPNKVYQLFRDPDELAKAAPTFNGIQLLLKHVPVNADDHQPDLVVGTTATGAEFNAPYLDNGLIVWVREGIDAIESEKQKELSSAYRYRADMTPGAYQGVPYDGVMRDIVGNHVALVEEGRAGADVVVGDAATQKLEELFMTKPVVLSRKAAMVQGALAVYLKPKLANDAKIDLVPTLKDLTSKNFAEKKPGVITSLKEITKDKLAKDASLDDVTGLLDALEKAEMAEGDATEPNSGLPLVGGKKDETMDAATEFLKGKLSSDDFSKFEEMSKEKKAGDATETPEEKAAREAKDKAAKDAADKKAKDEAEAEKDKPTKAGMDAAIAKATQDTEARVLKTQRDLREAEEAVRPYVGKLAIAHDSAESVYRTALTTLGVDKADVEGLAIGGLKAILKQMPLADAKDKKPIAMDASALKDFSARYPDAAKITLG